MVSHRNRAHLYGGKIVSLPNPVIRGAEGGRESDSTVGGLGEGAAGGGGRPSGEGQARPDGGRAAAADGPGRAAPVSMPSALGVPSARVS